MLTAVLGLLVIIGAIVCFFVFGKTKEAKDWNGETYTKQITPPKSYAAIPAVIGIVLICISCVYAQSVGEVAVIRNLGGSIAGHTEDAGFHIKAPWQDTIKYDVRNNILSFMGSVEEEQFEGGSANGSGVIINDRGGASATIDIQVNYSLDPSAAEELYENYGTQENFVKSICAVDIRAVPRQVAGQFDTITILTAREDFSKAVWEALETKWKAYGLVIEQVNIQYVEYPQTIKDKYTEAQAAEIAKQTAENNKNVAEVEAQTKVVQAQGEAEANKIVNESLTAEVIQQHYIEALEAIGAQGNLIVTDGNSQLLINKNQRFALIL